MVAELWKCVWNLKRFWKLGRHGNRTMSDIVAEVADVTEFFEEINGLIRLGDALHPDDAAGERDYAIRVIDTMRRLERHVIKAHAAALRVALRE